MQREEAGAPPQDTLAKRDGARNMNIAVSAIAIAAAVGFSLGGNQLHFPSAIVLALVPAVLIYLVNREPQLYAVGKPKGDPRTDLGFAFVVCGFGLIVGNDTVYFVETQTLLELAGLVGLLCCALVFESARKNPQAWGVLLSILFFGGAYGYGLASAVDSLRDHSTSEHYEARVIDKYESYHRGTTYHLLLEPWGPQISDGLTVSSETYENTRIGSQVCFELHPGTLHVHWYRLVTCDEGSR